MNMMKVFYWLPAVLCLSAAQAETDIWYNAAGQEVSQTPTEKEKKAFVPEWKKRELARLEAQRTGSFDRGVRFSRNRSSFGIGSRFYSLGSRTGFRRFTSPRFRSFNRGSRGSFRGNRAAFRGGRSFVRIRF